MITNFELKLGSVKETLSREQMKQITGGVQQMPSVVVCWWETDPTNPSCGASGYTEPCEGTEDYCQGYMDWYCETNACCNSVDC